MSGSGHANRDFLIATVKKDCRALQFLTNDCKRNREIVLAAVQADGRALAFAADSCKSDRQIVLAAVKRTGSALQFAAASCKREPAIVQAAVEQDVDAFDFAAEELLLDRSFAADVKQRCFILKVCLMSGRHTYVVSRTELFHTAEGIVNCCCKYLGLDVKGTEALVCGTRVVPPNTTVRDWPGIQPPGEISEYELVVGVQYQ
mmetsp:Transcript_32907/g.60214  ORF Transcript_32907/g.60214 Transcript_32907/m.60214 type:complete len:203 (+) Transcript_32907:50-658(+)